MNESATKEKKGTIARTLVIANIDGRRLEREGEQ